MTDLNLSLANAVNVAYDAEINPADIDNLPTEASALDAIFTADVNFMSGNYQESSTDANDIVSNVSFNMDAINLATFTLSTDTTGAEGTVALKAENVTNGKSGDHKQLGSSSQKLNGALLGTLAASLFGHFQKTAAINNDTTLLESTQVGTSVTGLNEAESNYTSSKIFKRYVESGRYAEDTSAENAPVDYNFTAAKVAFVVKVDGTISGSANNDMNSSEIAAMLADKTASVGSDGVYNLNVLFVLNQNA